MDGPIGLFERMPERSDAELEKTVHSDYGNIRNERTDLKTADLQASSISLSTDLRFLDFMDWFKHTVPGLKNLARPPLLCAYTRKGTLVNWLLDLLPFMNAYRARCEIHQALSHSVVKDWGKSLRNF